MSGIGLEMSNISIPKVKSQKWFARISGHQLIFLPRRERVNFIQKWSARISEHQLIFLPWRERVNFILTKTSTKHFKLSKYFNNK